MKKKLEAELISIAHRLLKLKNKSDVIQLHQETRTLYEKLSALKFLEENFADVKPTIGKDQAMEIYETAFDDKDTIAEEEVNSESPAVAEVPQHPQETEAAAESVGKEEPIANEHQPDPEVAAQEVAPEAETPQQNEEQDDQPESPPIAEHEEENLESVEPIAAAEEEAPETPVANKESNFPAEENVEIPKSETEKEENTITISDQDLFKPTFEWSFEAKTDDTEVESAVEIKPETGQVPFDELLGKGYTDPVFVTPEDLAKENSGKQEYKREDTIPITRMADKVPVFQMNNSDIGDRTVSLNDRLSKGITVGLNDRIAFVKNLFGNSNEDYNRVLSQLITFDTLPEAQEFIDNMVKPDYNNWEGKDEYAQRFMEVVEKKFT